jgi:2-amino-4-hydroxy-6-hydroxymethyldihydropteridine diphosphokinase
LPTRQENLGESLVAVEGGTAPGDRRLRRGYLGLGSNVGDRIANLRAAADALPVVARSSVYETAPQGEVLDQPDFLNAAVEIETELGPEELLDLCKDVERRLGRDFGQVRHGPRVVDVDLLLLDGADDYRSGRLTLPHPEVRTRRFVLEPLVELGVTGLDEALAAVRDQRVERVGSF